MRNMDATLRTLSPRRARSVGKTPTPRSPVSYEQFRDMAWAASQQIQHRRPGVIPIASLRRALVQLPYPTFNQHLLRLERNGLVYLIPPEDPASLSADEQRECLPHPGGDLRSFVLWMSPKTHTPSFWD